MTVQVGRKKNVWLWASAAVLVVLAAGGAGVGLRYAQSRHPAPAPLPQKPLQKDVSAAQDLALRGDFTDAQNQLSTALKNPNLSADDRYQLLYEQGATYQNQGNTQAAMDAYQQAAKVKETQSLYESMAVLAEQMGNKDQAITFYKKAIQLIPKDSPVGDADKDGYQQKITELGGQP